MDELAGDRAPGAGRQGRTGDPDGRPSTAGDGRFDRAEESPTREAGRSGLALLVEEFDVPPSALTVYRSPVDGTTLATAEGDSFVAVAASPDGVVTRVLDAGAVDREELERVPATDAGEADLPGVDGRRGD